MSNDKNHSEEFERYLKGQMSPEEAHAFESGLLDDPFAQEALEGMESQDPKVFVNDLKNLKKHIYKKRNREPDWLRVAAMIAMLIVGSIAVFYLFTDVEQSQLASEEETILPLDSNAKDIDDLKEETIAKVVDEAKTDFDTDGLKVEDEDEEVVEKYLAENEAATLENIEGEKLGDNIPDALAQSDEVEVTNKLDDKIEVIQLAEVEALEEIVVEELALDETIVMEEVVPAQTLSAKRKEVIENESFEPVEARSTARSSSGAGTFNNPIYIPAKPSIGDSLYQQYLKTELIYPEAAKQNNIEGEVILRLTINDLGEIIDIKIEKSLGYGCDEEAIRLINEGPVWVPEKKDGSTIESTITIHVNFRID